jgi:hypothetical protein
MTEQKDERKVDEKRQSSVEIYEVRKKQFAVTGRYFYLPARILLMVKQNGVRYEVSAAETGQKRLFTTQLLQLV